MSGDDLISRDETIKYIKKWFYILGSWKNIDGMYSCSECGSQFYDMSPYCPVCGAKMKQFLSYGR